MKGMKFLGCAGAFALLVAATGASAQEEGEAMKSILGSIGIIPKDKPPIVYNERAPLVLPPKMDLPAPAAGSSEARNANWPKDPDVAARRKAAADARTPVTETEFYKNNEGKRLSIEEMRAGRNPNNYNKGGPAMPSGAQSDVARMSPDELRSFKKDENVKLSGNGIERRYLSDPPGELLKAQGGRALKTTAEPVPMGDPDGPYAFIREQEEKNRQ